MEYKLSLRGIHKHFLIPHYSSLQEDAVPCSEEKEAQSCPSFHPETLEIQFAEVLPKGW